MSISLIALLHSANSEFVEFCREMMPDSSDRRDSLGGTAA
jgi:hypothetical protein